MAEEIETGAPNFDCMHPDDLMDWWSKMGQSGRPPLKVCQAMFPGVRKGLITTVQSLKGYASNKHAAHTCRMRGDVESALRYEALCDSIYDELPEWALW